MEATTEIVPVATEKRSTLQYRLGPSNPSPSVKNGHIWVAGHLHLNHCPNPYFWGEYGKTPIQQLSPVISDQLVD